MNRLRLLALAFSMVVALPGCGTRNDTYATMAEVRQARLIEKGWLPAFMPPSTRELRIRRDMEDSAGEGSFTLDAADYGAFTSKLQPYRNERSRIEAHNAMFDEMRREGASAWTYSKGGYRWVFLCDEPSQACQFAVW